MSTYEYMSEADKLELHPAAGREDASFMAITELDTEREAGIYMPNADVPTVALELLKAAGQESVIVPRKLAGEVVPQKHALYCGGGDSEVAIEHHTPPARLRTIAANYIALAEYIEGAAAREAAEKAEAEAAEKKLQERRDALSLQLNGEGEGRPQIPYARRSAPMRQAINRIIELEDGASRD